jgi:hypothetical protein
MAAPQKQRRKGFGGTAHQGRGWRSAAVATSGGSGGWEAPAMPRGASPWSGGTPWPTHKEGGGVMRADDGSR